jgi:hypothetical protein
MSSDRQRVKRAFGGLLVLSAVAGFVAAGCSEIHPAPNDEQAGDLQSPTQEQDELRQDEQRQEEGRGRR